MKKIVPYIVILGIGLFLGWLFFGSNNQNETPVSEQRKTEGNVHDEVEEWTCSMHPQIRQPEPGKCPICGMDLIPVSTGNSKSETLEDYQIKLSENALALANVQTIQVAPKNKQDVSEKNMIKLSGQIEENESSFYTQTAHIGGRLESFRVTYEGEYVKRGQFIGAIYSPEIVSAQQELLIASESKKIQPEIYNAVKQKLRLWKLSNAEINQIERTRKIKTDFPLYADASGIVKQRIATIGTHVQSGAPLYTLINLSKVWIILDAYEKDIPYLQTGQKVVVNVSAYPDEQFEGRISFIEPVLNTKTRTVPIRIEIINRNMKLKPGMLAVAEIEIPHDVAKNQRLTIPRSAVIWTGKRSVIYVKPYKEEPVFEMREIEVGNTVGEEIEVLTGLEVGEEIVVNGAFTIDSAAQLQGKKSMMNSSEKKDTQNEKNSHLKVKVNKVFKTQLNTFYNAYIKYKDFLVEDKSEKVVEQSKVALKILNDMKEDDVVDQNAKNHWITLKKEMETLLKNSSNSTDIEKQRYYFKSLSTNLLSTIEMFGGIEEKVYELYCPMAGDSKGAIWLSKENDVLNPYLGAKMLKCGEVKREIIHKN
ncbi:MAG: efflux RND transporter periplasmic adaptor subunit [Flavobacteriales bacterium]